LELAFLWCLKLGDLFVLVLRAFGQVNEGFAASLPHIFAVLNFRLLLLLSFY